MDYRLDFFGLFFIMSSASIELEPVTTGDNTERKVPLCSNSTIHSIGDENHDVIDVIEYNKLSKLFHDLPTDLFVPRILKDYSSCETTLAHIRLMLFDTLREIDDFPYGADAELKRRVATRRSPPVCVKLANDIHVILSILEGDEYTLVKELLSTSTRGRFASQSRAPDDSETPTSNRNSCSCSQEIPVLKDTIATLQSDLLLLKQRTFACEILRTDEMRKLSESLLSLKCDTKLNIDSVVQTITSAVMSINVHPESNHADMNTKLRDIDARIKVFENLVDGAEVMAVNLNALCRVNPHGSDINTPTSDRASCNVDISCVEPISCDVPTSSSTPREPACVPIVNLNEAFSSPGFSSLDIDALENFLHNSENVCSRPDTSTGVDINFASSVPLRTTDSNAIEHAKCNSIYNNNYNPTKQRKNVRRKLANSDWRPARHVSFADIRSTIGTPSEPRVNGIPVRITDRCNNSTETFSDIDSEFVTHIKKRTKRFFLGGFKKSVTNSIISKYITSWGFKVSMIRIFPCKRSPEDVIVRFNIEDTGNLSQLQQLDFWPDGIVCKPWLSRGELSHNRNTWSEHAREPWLHSGRRWNTAASNTFESYNIYEHLNID